MRQLPARPVLPGATSDILAERTAELVAIVGEADRKGRARALFKTARSAEWFGPVVDALRGICGQSDVCMYCSANEPSQIDRFRPIDVAPEDAMVFTNYVWACDICNRSYKGTRFPPHTEPGEQILNPIDDNVWEFFFLEENYGRLVKRVSPDTLTPLPRAVSTCEVLGIDRESVQDRRIKRLRGLRREVAQACTDFAGGNLTPAQMRERIQEWRDQPFQADVADYFLNGPGQDKEPFRTALTAAAG